MFSFRRWLAGVAIVTGLAHAQPLLTTIQDILYNADGTRFNGMATISWSSFDAADTTDIASHVLRVPITSGYLQVQLVPTTNVNLQLLYSVTYNGDGGVQFSETWAVPPSTTPLRVRDVRVTAGAGSVVGPAQQTTVQISDVAGLQNALNIRPVMGTGYANSRAVVTDSLGALDGAIGNLTDCMHVDGTSGPCGGAGGGASVTFVDGETPAGTIDGINTTFTLAFSPSPASSLTLFRNGLLIEPGLDYALTTNTITFATGLVPVPGDILQGSYRLGGTIPGVGFVDNEVPSGTLNGVNTTFSTSQAPNPSTSLALYRNGVRLKLVADYTVTSNIITFASGLAPLPGDMLECSYRVAQ